jgi:hypothetical protein
MYDAFISDIIATVLPTLQLGITIGDYVKHMMVLERLLALIQFI